MKPSEIFQPSRSTDQVNQEIQEQPDSEVMDPLVTGSEEVEEIEVSDRIDVEDTNVDFFDKRINTLKKIKIEKVHVKRNSLSKIVSGKTVTEESVANKVRLRVCEQ